MRSASSLSASRSGRPKFCWSNVFLNSGPTGSGSSSATMPIAVWNAWPARMRARQQVERFGELLLEAASSAPTRVASEPQERQRADDASRPATPRTARGDEQRRRRRPSDSAATRLITTTALGVVLHARLLDQPRQARRRRRLSPAADRSPAAARRRVLDDGRVVARSASARGERHVVQPPVEPPRGQHAGQSA